MKPGTPVRRQGTEGGGGKASGGGRLGDLGQADASDFVISV